MIFACTIVFLNPGGTISYFGKQTLILRDATSVRHIPKLNNYGYHAIMSFIVHIIHIHTHLSCVHFSLLRERS